MEKLQITNIRTSKNYKLEMEDTSTFFNDNLDNNEEEWGKPERWMWLDNADAWELTREDDRREVEITPFIPQHIIEKQDYDEDGNPVGDPYSVLIPDQPATYRTEIHVPDDYVLDGPTNIDAEIADTENKNRLKFKKKLADEVIIHINSLIEDMPAADKITLLSRPEVNAILTFLNYGSIEQSRDLASTLTTDTLLTEAIKLSVVANLDEMIALYNLTYA